jgi:thioredoxin 1
MKISTAETGTSSGKGTDEMSELEPITNDEFEPKVIESATPVLVDFYATWCPPCRMLAPVLEDLSRELAGRLLIVRVNVDEEPDLAARYRITAVPTMILFKDGVILDTTPGFEPKDALKKKLEKLIGGK